MCVCELARGSRRLDARFQRMSQKSRVTSNAPETAALEPIPQVEAEHAEPLGTDAQRDACPGRPLTASPRSGRSLQPAATNAPGDGAGVRAGPAASAERHRCAPLDITRAARRPPHSGSRRPGAWRARQHKCPVAAAGRPRDAALHAHEHAAPAHRHQDVSRARNSDVRRSAVARPVSTVTSAARSRRTAKPSLRRRSVREVTE